MLFGVIHTFGVPHRTAVAERLPARTSLRTDGVLPGVSAGAINAVVVPHMEGIVADDAVLGGAYVSAVDVAAAGLGGLGGFVDGGGVSVRAAHGSKHL